jgi:hypothetical protein
MNASTIGKSIDLAFAEPLAVVVRAERGGPVLATVPLAPSDFSDAAAETWRDRCLRKGHPELAMSAVPMKLVPLRENGSANGRCEGFAIEAELPGARRERQVFTIASLGRIAHQAAGELISAGRMALGHAFYYEMVAQSASVRAPLANAGGLAFSVSVKSAAPACLRLPIRPLFEQCTAVNMTDDEVFPVFFTAEALGKAETCSRRGAISVPPVESGGVLVGSLAYCAEAREFFVIVHDVLEVTGADQDTFSLSYSEKSWNRIQTILKARQSARSERLERLVGQCHGHNFLPNDGNHCDQCEKRTVCGSSSVFASLDDRTWMSAVFPRQPWALCHIFGLTARKEPVHKLYTLKDARWQSRGYFLLPEFNWNQVAMKTVPTPS